MTYLIKKLQHQELGSITINNPNPSRGRYLMMPKNNLFLSHLPHLSQTVLNDYRILTIIPLYKNHFERNYCTFVYNNDKHHGGGNGGKPRDEYRIYLNRALEGGNYYFERDDILVLKPRMITLPNEHGVRESEIVYFAYLEKNQTSALYHQLDNALSHSTIRGNYAVLENEIPEIESAIHNIFHPIEENNSIERLEDFNESTARDVTSTILTRTQSSDRSIADLFNNQTIFRNFVQVGYEGNCAITRQVIRSGDFYNLQAAHIHPRSHAGQYTPDNGILMCRDMHWAFDVGCFTINDDYTIRVHPEVESSYLHSFDGREIFIPENNFFRPSHENLHYHQNNIYGGFLDRGRI